MTPALELAIVAGAFVAGLAGVAVLLRLLFRRQRAAPPEEPSLAIDVAALDDAGPPPRGPRLECYNIPVRLAVLVLAPAGRGTLPPMDDLLTTIDQMTPGLAEVVGRHRPHLRFWPPQFSPRGFAHAFFANARLPGDRGRGTPWCSVAGKAEGADRSVMVGLALCAAEPNSLGQITVERPTGWLDVLRVKRDES